MKYFIITIDTEGDNLWNWKPGQKIHTNNTLYLQRFQNVCNRYAFKPVWLTNYEMIMDSRYVEFIQSVVASNSGELGMHLHAWNSPPEHELPITNQEASYLIEYPFEIMESKISFLTSTILSRTGIRPITHRAGRWAMNDSYYELLAKHGYKVDCSVTPNIDWSTHPGMTKESAGSNYSDYSEQPYVVTTRHGKILEVPMTIRNCHHLFINQNGSFRSYFSGVYHAFVGKKIWLRPMGYNLSEMLYLLDAVYETDSDYIMFMLHSSEFMPGGSPSFKDEKSIELLYKDINTLFEKASDKYKGITLADYHSMVNPSKEDLQ